MSEGKTLGRALKRNRKLRAGNLIIFYYLRLFKMICFEFILVKYSSSEPITIARHVGKKEKSET